MKTDMVVARELAAHYKMKEFTPSLFKRVALAVSGLIPRSYQVEVMWEVIRSVLLRQGKVIYIMMPRQSGKSQGLAETVTQLGVIIPIFFSELYPHMRNGFNVGIYAPSDDPAKLFTDKVKERLESFYYTGILGVHADINNSKWIKLSTGSNILTHTASPTSKCIEGPDLDLAVLEEAQSITEGKIIKSIDPQLAARNGTMVYIFTASHEEKEHGRVYYEVTDEMERRENGLPPNPDFHIIDLERCFSEPGTQDYRRFVLGRFKRYGIDHPAMQSQFFHVWDVTEGQDFMDKKTLRKCKSGPWLDSCEEPCVGGLDVAKSNDCTVMEVMRLRDRQIIYWEYWRGDDYVVQSIDIRLAASRFNFVEFRAENNPPGGVLNDFLEVDTELADGTVIPGIENLVRVNTLDTLRDQSFADMKLKTQNKQYSYPDVKKDEVDLFEKQMCALVRRKVGNKIRVDHQNKRGMQHKSDFPDSHRLTLDAADGFIDMGKPGEVEEREDKKNNSHSLKKSGGSRKKTVGNREIVDDDDNSAYGLKAKKRW